MEYLYPTCRITEDEFNRRHWDEGESLSSIARSIGIIPPALRHHLLKHGIKTRSPQESYKHRLERHGEYRHRYTLNQHFFDDWSPEMAWVLGLLFADGNIRKNGAQLTFASKDIDVIHKVRDLLEYTGPVQYNNSDIPILVISRVMVCRRLIELGIVPAKSKIMEYPPVPAHLERHFLRGFFEGDGYISVYPPENGRVQDFVKIAFTTTSQKFAKGLAAALDRHGLELTVASRTPGGNRSKRWDIYLYAQDAFSFCQLIYQDVPPQIRMERKHDIFHAFVANQNHPYT